MPHRKEKIFEIDDHINKRFEIKKRLGKGAYGIVWKAVDKKTREVVAVKKIFDAFRNQTDAQRTFREIMFLKSLRNHPNIIQLHSVHRAANNSDIYLGFEYMETDLHHVIKRRILKDIHKRFIMYQLLKAIKYIHSGNVVHRDLKPSNVLLDVMCRCKIADFGLARSLTQIQSHNSIGSDYEPPLTDYVATRWYRAPEILISNRRYSKGIDMWSLGCILGEMCAGKPIFPGTSTVNQIERIMMSLPVPSPEEIGMVCVSGVGASMIRNAATALKIPLHKLIGKESPRDALSLIQKLLIFNPNKRLRADEALGHPYVSNFREPDLEICLTKDVAIPFSDDIRLSIEDYRNKLYELMAGSHYHQHNQIQTTRTTPTASPPLPPPPPPPPPAVSAKALPSNHKYTAAGLTVSDKIKATKITTTASTSTTNGLNGRLATKTPTHSQSRINNFAANNNNIKPIMRSESKVLQRPSKCKVHMKVLEEKQNPKVININNNNNNNNNNPNSTNLNNTFTATNNNNNNKGNSHHMYYNYNQTHGVVDQSTLMFLKAASGLR